jgi:hypothetical protein
MTVRTTVQVDLLPLRHYPGRAEPVKAVSNRRATASVNLPGERTRKDDLDRTCPKVPEFAAIGSSPGAAKTC